MHSPNSRPLITRRFTEPPTPTLDVIIPILVAFITVTVGALLNISFPPASTYDPSKDFHSISYEYSPVNDRFFSVTARSIQLAAGKTTRSTSTKTFNKNSGTVYSLQQIFHNSVILSDLIGQPITAEILASSFAVDLTNQELITSVDGIERHIKFNDLEGHIKFEFSGPMFGLNPFAHKDPVNINCSVEKCLALTFDDGPSEHTDRLLDILQYSHARATFFVLGNRLWAFPGQISRMTQEGHDVGSHSWAHKDLRKLSRDNILADLTATNNTIQSITNQFVKFFRPPYGSRNATVNSVAADLGQRIVLWSIDPRDWQNKDANYVCSHVIEKAHSSGIVILHDVYGTTVDAAQCIIDNLSQEYTFVNLSTLYR